VLLSVCALKYDSAIVFSSVILPFFFLPAVLLAVLPLQAMANKADGRGSMLAADNTVLLVAGLR
jgi:hypothetical protein